MSEQPIEYKVGDAISFRWYGNMKKGAVVEVLPEGYHGLHGQYMLVVERTTKKIPRLLAVSTTISGLAKISFEELDSLVCAHAVLAIAKQRADQTESNGDCENV